MVAKKILNFFKKYSIYMVKYFKLFLTITLSNTTSTTCGAGKIYNIQAQEFLPHFDKVHAAQF
jgi:hypothetical protein